MLGRERCQGQAEPLAVCSAVQVCLDILVQHCGQIQQCQGHVEATGQHSMAPRLTTQLMLEAGHMCM